MRDGLPDDPILYGIQYAAAKADVDKLAAGNSIADLSITEANEFTRDLERIRALPVTYGCKDPDDLTTEN